MASANPEAIMPFVHATTPPQETPHPHGPVMLHPFAATDQPANGTFDKCENGVGTRRFIQVTL
jgi:hypothetical protein